MQVLQSHVGPLTNNEVSIILNKQIKWHQDVQKQHEIALPTDHKLYPTVWIANEVQTYLKETSIASTQTRIENNKLLNEINTFDSKNRLTRLEKLQILNLQPTTVAILYSIIDDIKRKFDRTEIEKLLQIITKYRRINEDDDEEDDEESSSDDDDDDDEEED